MLEAFGFTFVALLVIVDPFGTAVIFASMTTNNSVADRRRQAIKATAIAAVILVSFSLVGSWLLHALGIALPAMKVAGGLLRSL